MTQTGYSNAIVNGMLSWLKGLASWVLKLFNLSSGFSPLKFLANNWLKLLILFLIVGVAADLLVWLIRWRPHWVWFHKKRVIINDKNFFAQENFIDDGDAWDASPRQASAGRPARPKRNWEESEFVVPSAERRRREARASEEAARRKARAARVKSMQLGAQSEGTTDVFTDELFNVNAKQKFSDKYEDEVFSVSNLPEPEDGAHGTEARTPARSGAGRAASARSEGRSAPRRKDPGQAHDRKRAPAGRSGKRTTMVRGEKRPAASRKRPGSTAKKR